MTDDEVGAGATGGRQNPKSPEDRHLNAVKKAYREGRARLRELREATKNMIEERRELQAKLEAMAGELGLPAKKKPDGDQPKAAVTKQKGSSGKVGSSTDE